MLSYIERAVQLEDALVEGEWDKSYSNLETICDDLDFTYLAEGETRYVVKYQFDTDYVFKIAQFDDATNDNINEWTLYESLSPEKRIYLAKSVYKTPQDLVLVMECIPTIYAYASHQQLRDCGNVDEFREEVCRVVKNISDLHVDNIGIRTSGELVVIDYAMI